MSENEKKLTVQFLPSSGEIRLVALLGKDEIKTETFIRGLDPEDAIELAAELIECVKAAKRA